MSTFSKDHASSSCSSSTAANALRQRRGDEEEGGVRDMRNAKVDIFSRLFVALGLCQLPLTISNAAHQFGGTSDFKNEDDTTTKSHDIEQGAMQPSTEHNRTSDNGTGQMPLQNAVDDLLPHDEATTENRTFGCDINPSIPWHLMPWVMGAVIILLGLLYCFHRIG